MTLLFFLRRIKNITTWIGIGLKILLLELK